MQKEILSIKIIAILFLQLLCFNLSAQKAIYTSTSKSAINAYEDGTKYWDNREYDKAVSCFKKAISKDPNFIEAYMIMGDIYAEKQDYLNAISSYSDAVKINPSFFPNNFYHLATLELTVGRYEDAKPHFQHYLDLTKTSTSTLKPKAEQGILNCDFAIDAMKHPVPFDPVNMGPGINTKESEYYPSFTVDQKEIIFTRDIEDHTAMEGHQEDFYISHLKDSVWDVAKNAGFPLNSSLNEGAPSISADGRILFFTACERPDGQGSCDIYISQKMNDGSWSKPQNIGPPINTAAWESQPSFSSDGKTLYFVRGTYDRSRNMHQDIYVSTFQENMKWSEPIKLGDNINTDESEESVFIHPDNQTLYFSSKGHTGMGGLDIFMSRRQADGTWGPAINLGYPINTCGNENSLQVSADGRVAYFASDRKGGYGGLDLYQFNLYKEAQPLLVSYVHAKVIDDETGNPVSAQFEINDIESGKSVVSNATDKKRGEFLACLPAGKNYMLNVNKEQYLFYSDYFECKEATDKQHAYEIIIRLKHPKAGEKVIMKNIFFDVAKFDLKAESNIELNKLTAFLKNNPEVRIEISGHTDNTGDKKANVILSENRAKSVFDYLVKQGIVASRLTYKGYGDTKPIVSNETEIGRSQNRRTEFTIL